MLQILKKTIKCSNQKKQNLENFKNEKLVGLRSNFGVYGIQALDCGRLSAACIEAARRAMTRKLKRTGQIWIRVFPDLGVSQKPAEVRMGKGKGSINHWVCPVKKGQILFELNGIPAQLAAQAAQLAQQKLCLKTQFIESI